MQQITVEAPSKRVAAQSQRARRDSEPYHPLDGLSPAELRIAAAAVNEHAEHLGVAPVRFNSVHIQASRAPAPAAAQTLQRLCRSAVTCGRRS